MAERHSRVDEEDDPPDYVMEDVCTARMSALDTKLKYLFGTSIITIVLIIVNLLKG
jgi:hypothetical protein